MDKDAKYPGFLPSWNTLEHYPPYEIVEIDDRARISLQGTEITGLQLSTLTREQKDELALLSVDRGVLVFRDQHFGELGPDKVVEWHKYFDPLHIHPTSGQVEGYPNLHLVYRILNDSTVSNLFKTNLSSNSFHSDNSYELQPLSYTSLTVLESPPEGGDTVFVDMEEAYNRLSPLFKSKLEGLQAIHSSVEEATGSKNYGGIARREGILTPHPIVRTHSIGGKKSLYINQQFNRRIQDLKNEENDAILKLLFTHITQSADFSLRAKWEPNTVVFWDNRELVHTAVSDWDLLGGHRRHAFRLGTRGEVPQ